MRSKRGFGLADGAGAALGGGRRWCIPGRRKTAEKYPVLDDLGLGGAGVRCMGAEAINPAYFNGFFGHEHLDALQHCAKFSIADLEKTYAKCHRREREG